jgi:hypothetical protein
MSLKALEWAFTMSVSDPVAKLVLLGLAWHAHDDGTGCYPSETRLEKYTGLTARTIRRKFPILIDLGLIRHGNPMRVAHLPINRRPQVWELNVSEAWGDRVSSQEPAREDSVSAQKQGLGGQPDRFGGTDRPSWGDRVSAKRSLERSKKNDGAPHRSATAPPTNHQGPRQHDKQLFRQLMETDHYTHDGGFQRPIHDLYRAMQTQLDVAWPGQYLQKIDADGGIDEYLAKYDIERCTE